MQRAAQAGIGVPGQPKLRHPAWLLDVHDWCGPGSRLRAATKMGDKKDSTEASARGSRPTARYRNVTARKPSTPRRANSQRRLRRGGGPG